MEPTESIQLAGEHWYGNPPLRQGVAMPCTEPAIEARPTIQVGQDI